ncbi:MAG: phage portal protein, partial [Firmicutes bacterium]|nr:phage portal protein [Bacillota bacterium]
MPHNWHKLLVDQKVSYLVGKPIVFQCEEQKEYEDRLNLILGEEWDDTLTELAKNSSNKGSEWLHVYINEDGKFKFIILPAEE